MSVEAVKSSGNKLSKPTVNFISFRQNACFQINLVYNWYMAFFFVNKVTIYVSSCVYVSKCNCLYKIFRLARLQLYMNLKPTKK